jgi:hypothetical protein
LPFLANYLAELVQPAGLADGGIGNTISNQQGPINGNLLLDPVALVAD